jgi:CheY-like chemotaxis protein
MCGVEATKRIKAMEQGRFSDQSPEAPKPAYLVGMSACIESPLDWLAAGLDEMLPKPFTALDIEGLLAAIYAGTSTVATTLPGIVPDTDYTTVASLSPHERAIQQWHA